METYLESTNLEELILSQNTLGSVGIDHISALLNKPQFRMKRLDLSSCKVKPIGMTKLL